MSNKTKNKKFKDIPISNKTYKVYYLSKLQEGWYPSSGKPYAIGCYNLELCQENYRYGEHLVDIDEVLQDQKCYKNSLLAEADGDEGRVFLEHRPRFTVRHCEESERLSRLQEFKNNPVLFNFARDGTREDLNNNSMRAEYTAYGLDGMFFFTKKFDPSFWADFNNNQLLDCMYCFFKHFYPSDERHFTYISTSNGSYIKPTPR